jgi:hypothetical protein
MIDLKRLFGDESAEDCADMAKNKTTKTPSDLGSRRKTYAEKLRDPRWQKKRLEVMERDEFTCVTCGRKDKTLNIHHWYYMKGNEPWDYPTESLVCLCEDCHERIELLKVDLLAAIGKLPRDENTKELLSWLTGYAKGRCVCDPWDVEEFANYHELCGAFCSWGINERWLDQVLNERLDQWSFSDDNPEESTGGPVLVSGKGFHNAHKFADDLQAQQDEVDRQAYEYAARRKNAGHEYAGWWL